MAIQDAQNFAILIGEKPGQMRRSLALKLKRTLAKHGKKGIPACLGAHRS